ncbi:uncharacterized protein LOC112347916 [Selaginella moellendorffii]|uniref:uncharacterized protein LOC112347916 n=1 Tax=Selaginella moellendorffii TaxID=88036 RepID=UPI000D1CFCB7|nr:uncharacterized protein LOC112347916 [Selaginella moellendorffii]|eukprot:XP_024535390.1 uncharacterized protein LOC112347916 [Selaginella moellendorffii]
MRVAKPRSSASEARDSGSYYHVRSKVAFCKRLHHDPGQLRDNAAESKRREDCVAAGADPVAVELGEHSQGNELDVGKLKASEGDEDHELHGRSSRQEVTEEEDERKEQEQEEGSYEASGLESYEHEERERALLQNKRAQEIGDDRVVRPGLVLAFGDEWEWLEMVADPSEEAAEDGREWEILHFPGARCGEMSLASARGSCLESHRLPRAGVGFRDEV